MLEVEVIIIGAGAAGLMCAITAGYRNRKVLVLDHTNKPGKKILMSGGGRCNFTNIYTDFGNFLSENKHFHKSALSRYTPKDFINLVKEYQIPHYEKTLGQLFCQEKASNIVNMLINECNKANVTIKMHTEILKVTYENSYYILNTNQGNFKTQSLVIATGGLSIPTMGASGFGYVIAKDFGINVISQRAGLVPFVLTDPKYEKFKSLSGIAVPAIVSCNKQSFSEGLLFTHRGLSGPAILQISSYWQEGSIVNINLLPNIHLNKILRNKDLFHKTLKTVLTDYLPKNVIKTFLDFDINLENKLLKHLSNLEIKTIESTFQAWQVKPSGTEGYRTAEVTLGGVDVNALSSKTFEVNHQKGLYFIGEVLDVTGWLGGYNFQWAWASGFVAGNYV